LKDKRDAELQRKTNISRTTQLASLIAAKDLAERLNNPSANRNKHAFSEGGESPPYPLSGCEERIKESLPRQS
jgi:hypothetical protein